MTHTQKVLFWTKNVLKQIIIIMIYVFELERRVTASHHELFGHLIIM